MDNKSIFLVWGNVAKAIILHAQILFEEDGIFLIDTVEDILGTAFSIITRYDLKERDYFEKVIRTINANLCLSGYPNEVITKYRFY